MGKAVEQKRTDFMNKVPSSNIVIEIYTVLLYNSYVRTYDCASILVLMKQHTVHDMT